MAHLQLGGVQRNVARNFLQTSTGAVDCRSFAVTHSWTFERLSTAVGGVFAFRVVSACEGGRELCKLIFN